MAEQVVPGFLPLQAYASLYKKAYPDPYRLSYEEKTAIRDNYITSWEWFYVYGFPFLRLTPRRDYMIQPEYVEFSTRYLLHLGDLIGDDAFFNSLDHVVWFDSEETKLAAILVLPNYFVVDDKLKIWRRP